MDMARKLYFHAAVKNNIPTKNIIITALRCAVVLTCISAATPGPVRADSIYMGGSEKVTRIVFTLKNTANMVPDVSEQNQTLNVNFPYIVNDPQTIQNQFMVQGLTFDGVKATIDVKTPFTYRVSTKYNPPSFVIDLAVKEENQTVCPIKRFEIMPVKSNLNISMFIEPDMLPEVRAAKDGHIYIHFPTDYTCDNIERLLSAVPQLKFNSYVKMSSGTVLTLDINKLYILNKTHTDKDKGLVVFDIKASDPSSARTRSLTAESLFTTRNFAGVIALLEPWSQQLGTTEKMLLARSYWALAFPYNTKTHAGKALSWMNSAIQELPEGLQKEQIKLEYCSMLINSGMANQALDQLKALKGSQFGDIRAEVGIREMDILNHTGAYQDAYAAQKRLVNDLGKAGIPARLKADYLVVSADTYLGLNDYAKSLSLYNEALAADPNIAMKGLGLYAHMGEAAFKINEFAQAKDYLIQAYNLGDPSGKQKYLLMLGDCLYQLGEKGKALAAFTQVETLTTKGENFVIAKLKSARIIIENNTDERGKLSDRAFNEVMDIYETLKTLEEYKDKSLSSLVKIRIAQAYAKHGQPDKALDTYLEVWTSTKKNDATHHYAQVEALRSIIDRARILHRDGKDDQIYILYMRYQNNFMKELTDSATLFIIGDSMNRLGHLDQARKVLELSTREESIYKEQALFLLFSINMKQGRYHDALLWNTLYLTTYPSGKEIQTIKDRRGEALYLMGSIREALPYLESSAAADSPLALNSLSYLADSYRRLGMTEQEQKTLDRIISYNGRRISRLIENALYLRANYLKSSGEFDRAKTLYQTLLDSYPKSTHTYWVMYHLSQIAYATGDHDEAKTLLTNVIRLAKDPLLLSAARVTSNDMELQKDLNRFDEEKSRMRSQ